MKVETFGTGPVTVGIVACLHGNELLGREVIDILREQQLDVQLVCVLAHTEAIAVGKRFLETDLNRSFPGAAAGSMEERLALRVLTVLKGCSFVLDIHTTTSKTEPFIITVRDDAQTRRIIESVPLERVVYMAPVVASGASLIDHVRGVSLEFPRTASAQAAADVVLAAIRGQCRRRQSWFRAVGTLPGSAVIPNFQRIEAGARIGDVVVEKAFYPVLSGEEAYPFTCIRCERMQ